MARITAFNSPLLLGFEHLEQILDRASRTSAEGYPPYNIEQTSDNGLRITLAVAGFSMNDLSVTIEDNQLMIRGRQVEDSDRVYIHRGIAARQFQRSFVLAEGIDVAGADMDNGLLHVDLERIVPEPEVRTIHISDRVKATKKEPKTIDVE
ncbi:MAG: Hsp20 family protein [Alphaproteobacteria bacterium]|jgi:HSP20 family molecular chaperone IbpA|nr:Hsp20 family protein [Alphaproteobacteria bacterium]